jgi:2-polyprenyl-6-methoxyphenol hydroxylase-like FAD-dependent oxidoreductase
MNTVNRNHAIVIGGSMAGLLAARVLSDHFNKITIIERDHLPDEAEHRAGVPQARHLHALLAKGQRLLEDFFPGFADDMNATGAPSGEWGESNAVNTTGGWTQRFHSGIFTNLTGRVSLEWIVRRRVGQIPNIRFMQEMDVSGLIATANRTRITGVSVTSRADQSSSNLFADLIVDASGRRSQAPEWLVALGYNAPEETIINAFCGYASRWYKRPANPRFDWKAVAIQPRAKAKLYRGGGFLEVEDGQWVVTILGANKDYPPTDDEGFLNFARSLADPMIYDMIKDAEPISPIYGYRRLENRMRHYERLSRRPENFIVTGDAACAFNPIYGQGMTAAALEAVELDKLLRHFQGSHLTGFAAQFQRKLAKVTSGPWLMATAEDLRYPDVEGDKPGLMTRFIHRYFDLVAYTMPYDNVVTKAFFEAMNLLKSPTASMMAPNVVFRVLRHSLRRQRQLQSTQMNRTVSVQS